MNIVSNFEFPIPTNKPQDQLLDELAIDIAAHASLLSLRSSICTEQTHGMEQLRIAKNKLKNAEQYPHANDNGTADSVSLSTGDKAIEKLSKIVRHLEIALRNLDVRHAKISSQIREIEERALTHVPQSPPEGHLILGLVASILEAGHKIDSEYLADVISSCLDVMVHVPILSEQVMHS